MAISSPWNSAQGGSIQMYSWRGFSESNAHLREFVARLAVRRAQ
jgi:hypothetical protein